MAEPAFRVITIPINAIGVRSAMTPSPDLSFVSLQVDYWDSPWQNRHAFLWELSERHPVFFQSPPFYLVDLLQGRHRTSMRGGAHRIKAGLTAYVPPRLLPYNYRLPRLDRLIGRLRDARSRAAAARAGCDAPVLLVWHPRFARELGKHDERLVVYYKYDNYAGYFSDGDLADGNADEAEARLLERADLVFVTSQGLYDMHRDRAHKLHLVPNGVDYEYFAGIAADTESPLPEDLAGIPGPRIGYVGVVNEKVDFRLLTAMCKARPDWSIVLVGPEKTRLPEYREALAELQDQPNAYFLGRKPGREVPHYIRGMDVCMMCYLVNDWTYYGYPLKMHEYLACGKPTVAADLPAIREFSSVIPIAREPSEWVSAVDAALTGRDGISADARQQTARANSWAKRVDQSLSLIGAALAERAGTAAGVSG